MVKVYRIVCSTIVVLVAVQAASIAWGAAGEARYVDNGGVIDKALVEAAKAGGEPPFPEVLAFPLHGINGGLVIPIAALALLGCSFLIKVPRTRLAAGLVVALVAVQVSLGYAAGALPAIGLLHGANALLVAAASWRALRLASRAHTAEPVASEAGLTP